MSAIHHFLNIAKQYNEQKG